MKGTNLVLDEQTLRLSQKKTYSEAVMIAMKEFIRVNEFSKMFNFQGITIRSSMDCLIASIALRNHTTVIHKDRDYSKISIYNTPKNGLFIIILIRKITVMMNPKKGFILHNIYAID